MRFSPSCWLACLTVAPLCGAQEIWRLDNLARVATHPVTVEGSPRVMEMDGARVVRFDGVKDGLFVDSIPFAGARQFTIEILFWPEEGGAREQRFFHSQYDGERRALIETRLNGHGGWWLDTFITTHPPPDIGVTLADPKQFHATNQWYWAALRYDGEVMSHYVNGRKELEKRATFAPFGEGKTSLGVRQNKVFWFKGAIREVRFYREAIAPEKLQRVPER